MSQLLQLKTQLEDFDLAEQLGIPRLTIREIEEFVSIIQGHTNYLTDLIQFEDPVVALHNIYSGNLEILATANRSPYKDLALEYMARAYLQYLKILRSTHEA